MNLQKLFEIQRILDEKIVKEKGLEGQDLLDKKILALQVELGELANEWQMFKFWSEDQEPRTNEPIECETCDGWGAETDHYRICMSSDKCESCNGTGFVGSRNPLLEEYVDCLHFILSIGSATVPDTSKAERFIYPKKMSDILDQLMWTNKKIVDMYEDYRDKKIPSTGYHFNHVFSAIWGLGEMLGFTWEQIEQAYYRRSKRQEGKY